MVFVTSWQGLRHFLNGRFGCFATTGLRWRKFHSLGFVRTNVFFLLNEVCLTDITPRLIVLT